VFPVAVTNTVIPCQVSYKPEVTIPLFQSPSSANLTIQYDMATVGNIVITLDAPGRVVLLVGRFDSQVTGSGVK
jgi:hypothetical protein